MGMQIGKRIESKWQILMELTEKSYYGENLGLPRAIAVDPLSG